MYFLLLMTLTFSVCNAQEESEDAIDICNIRNGYTKVEGSCDAYIECTDYQASRRTCPDGLNFNPKSLWPVYPCGYPADVPCRGLDKSQPPKPTDDCPRQHGFFVSPYATPTDCGQYRLCSEGHAFDMYCPFGLAFDIVQARCDWPDLVPGCNSEDFIGFICPAADYDMMGHPLISNHKYEGDCYMFYSCQSGRARLLSCDPGSAFDANLGRCVDADLVQCESDMDAELDVDDENE